MKVVKLWFEDKRIYVTTDSGETLYQSLYFYPKLLMATPEEREKYELWEYGISWSELDEDVSYESFYYEDAKEPANGMQAAFLKNPYLNMSAVARKIGIQQSLLASYIKGTKKPSEARKTEILNAIHSIAQSLLEIITDALILK